MMTEILFEELQGKGGNLGIITLNRPAALNSLNIEMIEAMYAQLGAWQTARHIKAVIIQSAKGRAFCAGGDIRLAYERMKNQDPHTVDFFRDEYQLNRRIFHFPKPYIALLDGITMGGGVGISIHGSHRLATDKLLFAMPETGIGFFPDVGASYFLPRLPHRMGYYLGLTGARINCDDCVALGIATQKVSSESFPQLIQALAETAFDEEPRIAVTKIIAAFDQPHASSILMQEQQVINQCFGADSMDEILHALLRSENDFCKQAASVLASKSPTSLKISLRALQNGHDLTFDDCMQQDYRLVSRFLKGHDFAEGIRAVIIDKDQSPRWKPAQLSEVSEGEVKKYFLPLPEELANS